MVGDVELFSILAVKCMDWRVTMRTMVCRTGDTISVPDVDIVTDECDHESQEDRSVTEQGAAYAQRLSPPMRGGLAGTGLPT